MLPLLVTTLSAWIHFMHPAHSWSSLGARCLFLYAASSAIFLHVSLAATHHCPEVWHAGDNPAPPSTESGDNSKQSLSMDWGVYQAMAIGSRPTVDASHTLASSSFGQHALHHMFPTIDQYYLQHIQIVYDQTLQEFGLLESVYGGGRSFTIMDGWLGLFKQV